MDFTLSLAHFCENHGPTSVLCTQALPIPCSACYPLHSLSSDSFDVRKPLTTYLSSLNDKWSRGVGHSRAGSSASDGCASCRISLPDDIMHDARGSSEQNARGPDTQPPLRTVEAVHACEHEDFDLHDCDTRSTLATTESFSSTTSNSSCHMHSLEFISNSSPAESDSFSSLRRATVRTLSGEQLPRGQTSGPLCFGDPTAGYTVAYTFRLADPHARGRQRYYALLALVGHDTRRAFEACTIIWNFFEQLASNIIETAEQVASRISPFGDSPPQRGNITPISSFLTGRTMDPDGYPRRGAANGRAKGIAALLDNENFFCELHLIFIGMLQNLGRLMGGMRIRPAARDLKAWAIINRETSDVQSHQEEEIEEPVSVMHRTAPSMESHRMATQSPIPLYGPALFSQLRQVTV